MKLMRWLRLTWRWIVRRRLIASAVAVSILLLVVYWEWFVTVTPCRESGSTTIRNLGLVAGGLFALWFAYRRSVVADRQARSSQDQAKAALHQAETSQRGLLNERYQKGAEMLGSEVLSVRLGGIYALQRLADDEPEEYHVQIMKLLCAFVCHPTKAEYKDDSTRPTGTERKPNIRDYQVREDVQEAMTAIGTRSDADVELEKKAKFAPDLSGAVLPFVYLFGANLTDAVLTDAKFYPANLTVQEQNKSRNTFLFSGADLSQANLSNAFLTGANLTRADLSADLSGTVLVQANLTGAFLSGAKGLTQGHLNQACGDPDNPPDLGSLRDAETGAPLEWRGKPCRK